MPTTGQHQYGGVADYFLKIDGIEGESHDSKFKATVEILAWNWSAQNTGTFAIGGGGGAGKVNMEDFHFSMHTNKASPKLMLACASGEHIKKAVLSCRKAGGTQQEYLTVTFSDCLISSYQIGGHGGDTTKIIPVDEITINFAKIEVEYKEQKPDGSLGGVIKAGWNVQENKKV